MNKEGVGSRAIHGGQGPYDGALPTGPVVEPIHMGSMFEYDTVEDYMQCIRQGLPYPMYTRATSGNPTLRILQSRLAAIYGAERALVTSSGMSAISTSFLQILEPGDHVLFGKVFRMTSNLMAQTLEPKMGITWDMVAGVEVEDFEQALTDKTRVIFLEILSNPHLGLVDLEGIAKMAHSRGIQVWVDDSLATPINLPSCELGADLITTSLTKYMCGHGNAVGGAIIGGDEIVGSIHTGCYGKVGAAMSPFNAWLTLQGLKTLHLRMAQHNRNAQAMAEFLQDHPKVEWIRYPGLPDHPQYERARKVMSGFAGMVVFTLKGGDKASTIMADSMKYLGIGTSFGQAETLCETGHMVFYGMTMEERAEFGVPDGFVRLSVGLEDTDDLIADMAQALDKIPEEMIKARVSAPAAKSEGVFRPSIVENE
jgi:cystathionine beta-lyase/cystathionine gamma-synthase